MNRGAIAAAAGGPIRTNEPNITIASADGTKRPPVLGAQAAAVYELLKKLPAHRALKGREIIDALARQTPPIHLDESTLTTHVLPKLKPWGLDNTLGAGYFIQPGPA